MAHSVIDPMKVSIKYSWEWILGAQALASCASSSANWLHSGLPRDRKSLIEIRNFQSKYVILHFWCFPEFWHLARDVVKTKADDESNTKHNTERQTEVVHPAAFRI